MKRLPLVSFFMVVLLFAMITPAAGSTPTNSDPPVAVQPVKLVFVHHSTGSNWLADGYGGLGLALMANNYFVSDTNYGWGPNTIGDRTDIPHWSEWFASANTPTYMTALYNESSKHSSYSRLASDPGGENKIIMFKSCFPNSNLSGNPNDPPSSSGWLTVGHAKYVYNQILIYFLAHPEKLFIVITAPPVQSGTYATNARAFNQWLMNDWLVSNNYPYNNVVVFDFYNVLTGPDNHHRYVNGAVEHTYVAGMNTLYYPSGDDHPNAAGSQKATTEFVSLLNYYYTNWVNTFSDVPADHWAASWIKRLYNAGITKGCATNPLRYCPEQQVTRAEMAVFLERGMNGSTYTPPAGTGLVFGDVPSTHWAMSWIEKLYNDGITTGCIPSPLSYCPQNPVNRAEMAKFLLLAKHGKTYLPPAATGIFSDVPTTHWAADWIEQLFAEGITTGCNTGLYCPEQSVTRAQMAAFLVRTFGLP